MKNTDCNSESKFQQNTSKINFGNKKYISKAIEKYLDDKIRIENETLFLDNVERIQKLLILTDDINQIRMNQVPNTSKNSTNKKKIDYQESQNFNFDQNLINRDSPENINFVNVNYKIGDLHNNKPELFYSSGGLHTDKFTNKKFFLDEDISSKYFSRDDINHPNNNDLNNEKNTNDQSFQINYQKQEAKIIIQQNDELNQEEYSIKNANTKFLNLDYMEKNKNITFEYYNPKDSIKKNLPKINKSIDLSINNKQNTPNSNKNMNDYKTNGQSKNLKNDLYLGNGNDLKNTNEFNVLHYKKFEKSKEKVKTKSRLSISTINCNNFNEEECSIHGYQTTKSNTNSIPNSNNYSLNNLNSKNRYNEINNQGPSKINNFKDEKSPGGLMHDMTQINLIRDDINSTIHHKLHEAKSNSKNRLKPGTSYLKNNNTENLLKISTDKVNKTKKDNKLFLMKSTKNESLFKNTTNSKLSGKTITNTSNFTSKNYSTQIKERNSTEKYVNKSINRAHPTNNQEKERKKTSKTPQIKIINQKSQTNLANVNYIKNSHENKKKIITYDVPNEENQINPEEILHTNQTKIEDLIISNQNKSGNNQERKQDFGPLSRNSDVNNQEKMSLIKKLLSECTSDHKNSTSESDIFKSPSINYFNKTSSEINNMISQSNLVSDGIEHKSHSNCNFNETFKKDLFSTNMSISNKSSAFNFFKEYNTKACLNNNLMSKIKDFESEEENEKEKSENPNNLLKEDSIEFNGPDANFRESEYYYSRKNSNACFTNLNRIQSNEVSERSLKKINSRRNVDDLEEKKNSALYLNSVGKHEDKEIEDQSNCLKMGNHSSKNSFENLENLKNKNDKDLSDLNLNKFISSTTKNNDSKKFLIGDPFKDKILDLKSNHLNYLQKSICSKNIKSREVKNKNYNNITSSSLLCKNRVNNFINVSNVSKVNVNNSNFEDEIKKNKLNINKTSNIFNREEENERGIKKNSDKLYSKKKSLNKINKIVNDKNLNGKRLINCEESNTEFKNSNLNKPLLQKEKKLNQTTKNFTHTLTNNMINLKKKNIESYLAKEKKTKGENKLSQSNDFIKKHRFSMTITTFNNKNLSKIDKKKDNLNIDKKSSSINKNHKMYLFENSKKNNVHAIPEINGKNHKKALSAMKNNFQFKVIKSKFLKYHDMFDLNLSIFDNCKINLDDLKELVYLPKKVKYVTNILNKSGDLSIKIPKLRINSISFNSDNDYISPDNQNSNGNEEGKIDLDEQINIQDLKDEQYEEYEEELNNNDINLNLSVCIEDKNEIETNYKDNLSYNPSNDKMNYAFLEDELNDMIKDSVNNNKFNLLDIDNENNFFVD